MEGVRIRPMHAADLGAADPILITSYGSVVPGQLHQTPAWLQRWRARAAHLLATDPDGCWVATIQSEVVGFALSFRRDETWFLASYAVRQDRQGRGIGRLLMEAAEQHGVGCPRAMLSASSDPGAEARYRAAGFTLHPQIRLTGTPRTAGEAGRDADGVDLDALDGEVRGAAHGPDHALLGAQFTLVTEPAGYAYLDDQGSPVLLCARDADTARRLLGRALARADGDFAIGHVTGANPWAREAGEAAGLRAEPAGWLTVRGMEPPAPYLHHGALL